MTCMVTRTRAQLLHSSMLMTGQHLPAVFDLPLGVTATCTGCWLQAEGGAQPHMYAAKDQGAAAAFKEDKSLAGERALPLGDRAQATGRVQGNQRSVEVVCN